MGGMKLPKGRAEGPDMQADYFASIVEPPEDILSDEEFDEAIKERDGFEEAYASGELDAFLNGQLGLPAARFRPVRPVRGPVVEKIVYSTALDPFFDMLALADYSHLSRRTLDGFTRLPVDPLPCYQVNGVGKKLVRRSEFDSWMERHRKRTEVDLSGILRDLK
jgi:hypothetical protein